MTAWTSDELTTIGAAEERRIAPHRRDGTLRRPLMIRVLRHGDDLYVRSVNGRAAAWFGAPRCAPTAISTPAASPHQGELGRARQVAR